MIADSWRAFEPFGDDHLGRAGDHPPDGDHVVVGVGLGEGPLGIGLEAVVEFFGDPLAELGQQRLDVQARGQPREQPGHAAQLGEVGQQGRARRPGTGS